jgi:hypothetical protein
MRADHSADGSEQGRLAGSVWTYQGQDFTWLNV